MSARIARLPNSEGKPVLSPRGITDPVSYEPVDLQSAVLLAVQASRALAAAGQADMVWGHASVRDPGGRRAWVESAGGGLGEIDAAKIYLVSPDGGVASGAGPRHMEYPIHTEIMAARP